MSRYGDTAAEKTDNVSRGQLPLGDLSYGELEQYMIRTYAGTGGYTEDELHRMHVKWRAIGKKARQSAAVKW